MKCLYLSAILVICFLNIFSQKIEEKKEGEATNQRISFMIGPGASKITTKLYQTPSVNPTNNVVSLEEASTGKSNLSIGISYTPRLRTYKRTIDITDAAGNNVTITERERVSSGMTIAAFLNPITVSKSTETQPFFNMLDFGVGVGHKFRGGFAILGTAEFFSVRQPRTWFINQFKTNDKTYEIGGAQQQSIDVNNDNIFSNKLVLTFGFKICYNFDIIKNYITATTAKSDDQ